jgi:RimJ/RimL family protein N-acetyltransferase
VPSSPRAAEAAPATPVTSAPGERQVDLPGGRTLTVRPLREGDAPALDRLFEGLSLDDRYRRFFSVYHPPRDVLDHMIHLPDEHGCALVAIVADASGREDAVGEATCSSLADGNGELGITIARRWRGWLGPFLLDALLEAAAARGFPKVEADVMIDNRAMLALLRARGAEHFGRGDLGIVRVAIPVGTPSQAE